MPEGAAPATPSTGYVSVYAKVDGLLYSKDDAGVETPLGNTATGTNTGDQIASTVPNTPAGNIVATDVQAAINELDTEKLSPADIGVTIQAYDADLTTWAGVIPGTGVAAALAVNVGTAGSPVVNGGALGTPSSGVTDNLTTTTTATAITDTDFVDTNLAAGGKRKILWTAVKTYLNGVFGQLTGNLSQFASGGAIAPASINGVTVDSTTNKPVTAASLNGGTLPASVTTLAISTALADNDSDTSGATTAFVQSQIANNNNPTAIAQSINMTAATSGSNGIQVADNANIDCGTGNFTLHWEGSLPDWTPSANQYFIFKHAANVGYWLNVQTSGVLRLGINENIYSSTIATNLVDNTFHKISVIITRESASVAGSVAFYVDGIQLGASVAITAGIPATTDNASSLYLLGYATVRTAGSAKSAILYTRALSASEVLDLCRNGVAFADKGASQTAIYTSDFSAGVDSWSAYTGVTSIAENIDSIGGENDWLMGTIDSTTDTHGFRHSFSSLPSDKRYKLSIKVFNPSLNSIVNGFRFASYGGANIGTLTTNISLSPDTVTILEFEFYWGSTLSGIQIQMLSNSSTTFAGNGTDVLYIKDFILKSIGSTLSLEHEGIQPEPGQWLDSSGNKLHAKMPIEGATTTRRKKDFEVRWSNTWAGTQEAQYVGGVNENILPSDNIRIESITMRCSATGVNVILGDGSATARWVASVALATYLDCTVANRNHDGTNRKLVIKPSANYTGTITTTIIGRILD